ncbi:MAG: ABC transporter substrate-binding protein [Candidatus Eremiobacteraeota bacterium]|nr:ABC transporter substrate-binding protein [Candidatus Eremiobacteraeota bacterium]
MKVVRSLLALALCASMFAACTKNGGVATKGGRNAWTIPGTLRYGREDEPDSLNPMFAHTDATDQTTGLLFSGLLRYDDNGNYIPDLATAVPTYANGGISKDNKTITVHMRKGVVWSDGAPLNAQDWMFTYHAVKNPANNTKLDVGWDNIQSASAPNDYTIVIHLKKPDAAVLGILADGGGSSYPPLPAHLLGKLPDINRAPFNEHPISSGPFLLQRWDHGSRLVFVANPKYFRGKPKLDKVIWSVVPDPNTLFNELKTHEIDVYSSVGENDIARLNSIPGITVNKKLVANWRHMGINTSRPQLHDRRVRLAIAEAIDFKRINDTIYHGYNELATSDVFPLSWAAPTIPPYKYDPQDSKRLLAAAGWTMGSDGVLHKGPLAMNLTISTQTNKQPNEDSEIQIQSQLKPLGINVTIHNYPVSLLFAQNGPLYSGHYDLEWSIETNGPDPDNLGLWGSAFIPPHGANTSWLSDPLVDSYAAQAKETFDQAKRKALYQKEEERLHALVPNVVFYWENSYTGINSDVKNYKPAAFIQDTWNAWEWEI